MTCFSLQLSLFVTITPARHAMKCGCIIVTPATNCGAPCCDVLFPLHLEWLRGACSPSFVMPVTEAGPGWFGTPPGGARRWPEFQLVSENARLFHGRVIHAGWRCPETMKWLCIACRLPGSTRERSGGCR